MQVLPLPRSDEERRLTIQEASLMQRLYHPAIVRCREYFASADMRRLYIVQDYCRGGDLQKSLQARCCPATCMTATGAAAPVVVVLLHTASGRSPSQGRDALVAGGGEGPSQARERDGHARGAGHAGTGAGVPPLPAAAGAAPALLRLDC